MSILETRREMGLAQIVDKLCKVQYLVFVSDEAISYPNSSDTRFKYKMSFYNVNNIVLYDVSTFTEQTQPTLVSTHPRLEMNVYPPVHF